MRRPLLLLMILTPLCLACGEAPEQSSMGLALPWQAPLASCTERSTLGPHLRAILEIGGHDPCALVVDPSNLDAAGVCDAITIGIVRPLGLGYWMQDPNGTELVPLAFIVGFVDLRKDQLDAAARNVNVDLSGDGTASIWLYTDAELSTWPDKDALNTESDDDAFNLFEAKQWAREELTERLITFDRNSGDTTSNLEEACSGTLF